MYRFYSNKNWRTSVTESPRAGATVPIVDLNFFVAFGKPKRGTFFGDEARGTADPTSESCVIKLFIRKSGFKKKKKKCFFSPQKPKHVAVSHYAETFVVDGCVVCMNGTKSRADETTIAPDKGILSRATAHRDRCLRTHFDNAHTFLSLSNWFIYLIYFSIIRWFFGFLEAASGPESICRRFTASRTVQMGADSYWLSDDVENFAPSRDKFILLQIHLCSADLVLWDIFYSHRIFSSSRYLHIDACLHLFLCQYMYLNIN